MRVLLCIDDTDNLDSAGTGEMLENICKILEDEGLCKVGFVSRHQLFIHEQIKYTSHNSSMCSELENVEKENIPRIIEITADYLEHNAAEGSDPGICLVQHKRLENPEALIAYGQRAKTEVLTKEIAYAFAAQYPETIHLSEHGGTGEGVIGALAGCGLRIGGSDGKVKGKLKPETPFEILSVKDFCNKYHAAGVYDKDWNLLGDDEKLVFSEEIKAFMYEGKMSVMVKPCENEEAPYITMSKDELKDMGVGY